jgi:fructose-bisphosphate aldolase class II
LAARSWHTSSTAPRIDTSRREEVDPVPIVDMRDMLADAYRHHYAVGAFDFVSLDMLEGILRGAERAAAPVILSIAESHFRHFDPELALAAAVHAAGRSPVPVAIHLDHGASAASAKRAIALGCNAVMVDGSHLPFEENAALTREVVELAHACGVPVEGELGYVPGVEGEDAELHPGESVLTSPEQAETFVARTGVDFLAVAVGTVHGRHRGTPKLDLERLAAIDRRLGIPLVLHGGSGLAPDDYRRLAERGIAKVNLYTALADAAAASIRERIAEGVDSFTGLHAGVREAVAAEVERSVTLLGSAGRAATLEARRWREVEHIVLWNPDGGLPDAAVAELFREGRERLARVPGVRRIFTGRALRDGARWRWAWVVRFAGPEVASTWRDHPEHVGFADERFRPVASDRCTIDFEEI